MPAAAAVHRIKTGPEHAQQIHEANFQTWHRMALPGTPAISVF
jgi:hypothetical protein